MIYFVVTGLGQIGPYTPHAGYDVMFPVSLPLWLNPV
ncbi:hypothetical protein [Bradyrhizobium sp. UFLA05-112]